MEVNLGCSGVYRGASGVLPASMGGMSSCATPQKARRLALTNGGVSFLYFI